MKQFNSTPLPAMQHHMLEGMSSTFYPLELATDWDDASWLMLSEPSNEVSARTIIRKADEISVLPAVFADDIHERMGLHPDVIITLFKENADTSWDEVRQVGPFFTAKPAELIDENPEVYDPPQPVEGEGGDRDSEE